MRLESTRKSDLAVSAMIELNATETRLKAVELADRLDTSSSFVGHVMAPLIKQRWVASDPGRHGGYRLLVRLEDVSVLQLIEAVEGPVDTGRCVLDDRPCDEASICALHQAWTNARSLLTNELARTSIADVAASNAVGRPRE